jgi:hypothetical protein
VLQHLFDLEKNMINGLMNMLPKGQGTYIALMAGVLVSWLMVVFPDIGMALDFEGGVTANEAMELTWAAAVGMFARRAVK